MHLYLIKRDTIILTSTMTTLPSDGTILVSLPRLRENVPTTFAVLEFSKAEEGPILVPFPDLTLIYSPQKIESDQS